MSIEQLDREILQECIVMLDQAMHNHQQWYGELTRTLICRLTPDQHDMAVDACHQCRLGQWIDRVEIEPLKIHPGFQGLIRAHSDMHEIVRELLLRTQEGVVIQPLKYDKFINLREKLQLEISALATEIEGLLYHRDPLTGAINRVNMLPYLREQHEVAKRLHQQTCIVMMDIDLFKKINDKYGHSTGDTVLVTVSHYLLSNLRSYDKVFRYGGEEFLICLPATSSEEGFAMIERIRIGISSISFKSKDSEEFKLTVSFGLSMLDPADSVESAIEHADKAVYQAKENGRNLTEIWKVPVA